MGGAVFWGPVTWLSRVWVEGLDVAGWLFRGVGEGVFHVRESGFLFRSWITER